VIESVRNCFRNEIDNLAAQYNAKTSISCRRRTRATRCLTRIVLYTELDDLCGKLALQSRGVVVRERGGTPFRQIFWIRNGAPANIVGHIGGKLTLKRSGKSRRSVYFLAQIAPKRGIRHHKSQKNFPG